MSGCTAGDRVRRLLQAGRTLLEAQGWAVGAALQTWVVTLQSGRGKFRGPRPSTEKEDMQAGFDCKPAQYPEDIDPCYPLLQRTAIKPAQPSAARFRPGSPGRHGRKFPRSSRSFSSRTICCAFEVMTYAGLPRFCAWAMMDAQTCSEEQLSIKAWPTAIRATSDPAQRVRGEADAANQCVRTFIFCSQEFAHGPGTLAGCCASV